MSLHALWLDHRSRVFTVGKSSHYGRMGMRYPSTPETHGEGLNLCCDREIDASSYGLLSLDERDNHP